MPSGPCICDTHPAYSYDTTTLKVCKTETRRTNENLPLILICMERMFPEFTQQPGKIELSGHIYK